MTLAEDTANQPVDFVIRSPASFRYYQLITKRTKSHSARPGSLMQACLSFLSRIEVGQLEVILPNEQKLLFRGKQDGPKACLYIHHNRLARRIVSKGHLGFCEAYLDGDWTSPDLAGLFTFIGCNIAHFKNLIFGGEGSRLWSRLVHLLHANTARGSKKNIYTHYDIGNNFFQSWLDQTMSYSAAVFETGKEDLATAQNQKYEALLRRLNPQPGDHILEIGCGWGGFVSFAAYHYPEIKITSITISKAQYEWTQNKIAQQGLGNRVDVQLKDYRELSGRFDHIVSIEMFEAVGMNYWNRFFEILHQCLVPGGVVAMQVITIRDCDFEDYRQTPDFIQHYIFPGGMLPSPEKLYQYTSSNGLELMHMQSYGDSYARTLKMWNENFQQIWPSLSSRFDRQFKRLWELYLSYCQGGFQAGTIDVVHFSLTK